MYVENSPRTLPEIRTFVGSDTVQSFRGSCFPSPSNVPDACHEHHFRSEKSPLAKQLFSANTYPRITVAFRGGQVYVNRRPKVGNRNPGLQFQEEDWHL